MKVDAKVIDVDLGYKKLSKTLGEIGKTASKAGVLASASPAVKIKAAKNQFGGIATDGGQIPPRPFLTQAWDAGGVEEYGELLISSLDEYLETGDVSAVERGFLITASVAEQDIREAIKGGDFVELAPKTIQEKGHDTILRDTDELLNSIDSEVIEQKGAFKPADTKVSISKSILGAGPQTGKRRPKRQRRLSTRMRMGGLSSLAKDPGYRGRGIRKRAEKRPGAAKGVVSQGVRRRGLRF